MKRIQLALTFAASIIVLLMSGPVARAQTLVATIQASTMSCAGSYAGPITSPFAGIALYGNGDNCYTSYNFSTNPGEYEIVVSGASSNSSSAGAALVVGGVQQGVMYFTGTSPTSQTGYVYVRGSNPIKVELLETTDNGSNDTYIQSVSIYYVGQPTSATPPTTGSYSSGVYQNLFADIGIPQSATQAKITAAWNSLFYGNSSTNAVYYTAGTNSAGLPMAYIEDVNDGDVRSEGISYGMMIALQLNHQAEFNALYTWAKNYELNTSGAFAGYFGWDNQPSGSVKDNKPAPDGDQWYAMDLLLASNRWGNSGEYNYQAEAFAILSNMINHPWGTNTIPGSAGPMFSATNYAGQEGGSIDGNSAYLPCFQPYTTGFSFTDPSYNLPAFYGLWSKWDTQGSDSTFWANAATNSRAFFHTACNSSTGLTSDYENFNGSSEGGTIWSYDSWRVAANVGVDNSWWAADEPWQTNEANTLQSFFESQGLAQYVNQYSPTGSPNGSSLPGPGLIGMNAVAGLAANNSQKWDFVNALWNTTIPTGQYRYYDGMLYMLALLECSGNFQIYGPSTNTTVPAAPTGLTATAGNAQVALSWSASSGATSYDVYQGTTSGGESTTPIATGITATTYTNTGLTNGTTYYYKVAAVNSAGTSAQSAEASAKPAAVPATPTGLTATAGNAQVALSWSASSGATSYNVYRSTTSGGEGSTAYSSGITSTSFTNTGLTNGTTYYYTVAAVNAAGTSAQSSQASATPAGAPPTPSGLSAAAGNAQISLAWSASTGATSYNVYRSTTSGGEGSSAYASGITSTSYTNTGLTNGTTYYYTVAAVNSVGTSSQTGQVSATPAAAVPASPSGLTATAGNAQVALSWSASSGATSYNVYRSTTSGGEGSTAIATGITTTTYTNTGLTNGTTYYYTVAAVNASGTSAQSAQASATPSASTGPLANGTYTLTPENNSGVELTADGAGTASGTALEIYTGSGASDQQWVFSLNSNGTYTISPSYDTSLCMTSTGTASGSAVELEAPTGATSQQWALTTVTGTSGTWGLIPQNATGMRLHEQYSVSSSGTPIQIGNYTSGDQGQEWIITNN